MTHNWIQNTDFVETLLCFLIFLILSFLRGSRTSIPDVWIYKKQFLSFKQKHFLCLILKSKDNAEIPIFVTLA